MWVSDDLECFLALDGTVDCIFCACVLYFVHVYFLLIVRNFLHKSFNYYENVQIYFVVRFKKQIQKVLVCD